MRQNQLEDKSLAVRLSSAEFLCQVAASGHVYGRQRRDDRCAAMSRGRTSSERRRHHQTGASLVTTPAAIHARRGRSSLYGS